MGNKGSSLVKTVSFDFSSTNVTSSAWVQLLSSVGARCNHVEITHQGSYPVYLGYGASGAEVTERIIEPTGETIRSPLLLESGHRLALKATGTTLSTGTITMNFFY